MMKEVDNVFIDTNIIVYATITSSPYHYQSLKILDELYNKGIDLWISRQVMREYLSTLTRPQTFTLPVPFKTLYKHIQYFEKLFNIAEDSSEVTRALLKLMENISIGGSQVHDANIVATMQVYGIKKILTNNISDFSRFDSLIKIIPLTEK